MSHHNHHASSKGENHKHSHGEKTSHLHHHERMVRDFKRRFFLSFLLSIPILLLSPTIQHLLGFKEAFSLPGHLYILFFLSSILFLYGGKPFLQGLWKELRKKTPGMMTLIGIAISTAYLYSAAVVFGLEGKVFFWELATLIDVMLLGHWIEIKSVMGASRALEELVKLLPSKAYRIAPDGSREEVPLEALQVGDRVLVKPGEKIPADGIIVEGRTFVDESLLTGESKPIEKKEGDEVIGGSVNHDGSIVVEIQKMGKDSFLHQVIQLVEEAQKSKSRTQDLANRAALWLTVLALSVGAITFFIWYFLVGESFAFTLERMVTVMVIACPHALGLAVPLVVAVSTSLAVKRGFFIRDRLAFERAKELNAVVFDKTGTLTEGKFGVKEVIALGDFSQEEVLLYAASLEGYSQHPIAQGVAKASSRHLKAEKVKAIPGKGIEGEIEGKKVMVVSPGFLQEKGISYEHPKVSLLFSQGRTVVFVLIEGKLAGAIALADIIRKESKEAISSLKRMGIQCMMLTGDNKKVAEEVAKELGLDAYFAEVLPHEKSLKIRELKEKSLTVAMVGDGVNDAPALVEADVGVAIGAGTAVAVESADIVLVQNDPRDVVDIIQLSRSTYRKMVQNLLWATGYNLFAIPIAAGVLYPWGVLLSPAIGAALMSLSTVIVAINARFLKVR